MCHPQLLNALSEVDGVAELRKLLDGGAVAAPKGAVCVAEAIPVPAIAVHAPPEWRHVRQGSNNARLLHAKDAIEELRLERIGERGRRRPCEQVARDLERVVRRARLLRMIAIRVHRRVRDAVEVRVDRGAELSRVSPVLVVTRAAGAVLVA